MIDFTQQEAYLLYSTDASVRRRAALAALHEAAAAGKNVFVTDPSGKISGAAAAAPVQGDPAVAEIAESTLAAAESAVIAAAVGENAAVTFWDVYAARGLALRTTASELGPYLMAMLLELNDAQSDLLQVLYQIADDNGLLLIDTKDLRALINEATENPESYEKTYGKVNSASASAILKAITLLEGRGGKDFLYEPAIDVRDFVGKGEPVAAAAPAAAVDTTPAENTAYAPAEAAAASSTTADAPAENASGLKTASPNRGGAEQSEAEGFAPAENADSLRSASPRTHILDAQDLSADEGLYRVMLLYLLSECAENAENADLSSLVLIIDDAGIVLGAKDKTFAGKMRSVLSRLQEREIPVIFLAENEADVPEELRKRLLCAPAEETAEGTEDTKAITLALRKEILAADPLAEKYKVPFERDSAYEFLLRRGLKPEEAAAVTQAGVEGNPSASLSSAPPLLGEADAAAETSEAEAAAAAETSEAEAAAAAETSEAAAETSEAAAETKDDQTEANEKAAKMAKRAKSSAQSLGTTVAGTVGRKIGKSIGENFGSFGSTLGGNVGASIGRGIMKTFFGE